MLYYLPVAFFAVACLYAMAGFGGGSTYIALLAVSGLPLTVVPVMALVCNLVVSSQGSVLLLRRGHAQWKVLTPLLLGSIPCAFLGGAWRLPEIAFILLLSLGLTLAGLAMLMQSFGFAGRPAKEAKPPPLALGATGAVLGLLAGVTGIGGGIYLAPVMHLLGWGRAHSVAACTSLFIALNSLAGLFGHLSKGFGIVDVVPVWFLLACPFAALVGGRLGSSFLVDKLPHRKVHLLTAGLVLFVAIRLWVKVFSA